MGKNLLVLLGTLLVLSVAHAAALASDNVVIPSVDAEALTASMRLAGESVSASPAKITDTRWIFLLYINGTPAAMADVVREGGGWRARVLQSPQELRSAVRLYHASTGSLGMARKELEEAQKVVLEYNSTRTRERDCLQALGLAQRPCTDYDSCLKSCFMSPEFCQPLAQANGQKFINQISDYQNKSQGLTGAVAASGRAYQRVWEKTDSASVAAYNASLSAIWFASAEMLRQPLSGPLCQKPFYDSAAKPATQARLEKALEWIEPVEDGQAEAQRLADGMAARKTLKLAETAEKGANTDMLAGFGEWPKLEAGGAAIAFIAFTLVIGLLGLLAWRSMGKRNRGEKEKGA